MTHPIRNLYSCNNALFFHSLEESPDLTVERVVGDAVTFVKNLKYEKGKGIWLCGGATLAATLFAESLINQLILKVNPFLMGAGIPLFAPAIPQTALELIDHKIYKNGVLVLHYRVKP